ncbi:unnamed protein product [Psylliodes chrysocephalus]|uniref:C2H2-type domain-containing protein n=1 Tax=Psylliodes chrysocephalus TaxID=3402493 RepID=A0A9P0GJ05_9CUCU|nr:unnamed protein product [Psylliodes chrysocephala]
MTFIMEMKKEPGDPYQQENLKIKQEPDSLLEVKLEPSDKEYANQTISSLNYRTNIKFNAENSNYVVSKLSSPATMDFEDIKEIQASDFFVNIDDIVNIKQEAECEVKTINEEFLNEECDLKSEEYFDQPSSKQSHEVLDLPEELDLKFLKKKYPCPICNKSLESAVSRKKHFAFHFENGRANCTTCGKVFTNRTKFLNHSLLHAAQKETDCDDSSKHVCEICSRTLKTRKTLLAHIKNHSLLKTPKCKVCSIQFKNKLELKLHMLVHKGRKPLKCDICSKEFLCKSFLDIHYRFHSGDKPFQCEICSKQFLVKSLLDHHMFVHKGIKPFKCQTCDKEFTHKPSFDRHVKKHQRPDFYSVEVKTECDNGLIVYETQHVPFVEPRPYECQLCSKTYRRKQELKKHMRNHTGERPYECHICQKRFTLKPVLQVHMKVHSGEKPYSCDVCFNKFSQKKNLSDHMRSHTGERPFKCQFCSKDFFYMKNLKEHVLRHTGEKPFKCDTCNAEFAASRYLKKHSKIHTKKELST